MSKADVAEMQGLIETYMRWELTNDSPRGYDIFHPSAFGGCLRQMQYQYFEENDIADIVKEDKEIGGRVSRIFGNGHGMHDRWAMYWERMGILKGVWECRNTICQAFNDDGELVGNPERLVKEKWKEDDKPRRYGVDEPLGVLKPEKCKCGGKRFKYHEKTVISKECNMKGHVDLILDFSKLDTDKFADVKKFYDAEKLPDTTIVADMKSIGSNGWRFLERSGPSLKYKIQLTIYANILDVDFGWLIYENKDTQDIMSFKIPKSTETVWKEVQIQAKKMIAMQNYEAKDGTIKHLLPPPRPLKKDSSDCRFCEFKSQCHSSRIWKDQNLNDKRKKFYGTLL